MAHQEVLVIKHGAFGDFIMAEGAFRAIRAHHKGAHITLLTSSPFVDFAQNSPYFDAIEVDDRRPFWHMSALIDLKRIFRKAFTRIYDLQTSGRTAKYHRFLKHPQSEWVGAVGDFATPKSKYAMWHIYERHRKQLQAAGIQKVPDANNQWLLGRSNILDKVTDKFVVLVTGASKEKKCWPIKAYCEIADHLIEKGYQIVLTGTDLETQKIAYIQEYTKRPAFVLSLKNQANFYDFATLSQKAALVIGNDTGPFHLMAMSGRPAIILLSDHTSAAVSVAPWESIFVLQEKKIEEISTEAVRTLIDNHILN